MNEKIIWSFLLQQTGNEKGTAAIMGNLMAESSLNPECATGKNKKADYTALVDQGRIDFANDGVAYGLVQWCYKTRKEGLLNFAKKQDASIGDLSMQLVYLIKEMSQSYKSVWSAIIGADDVRAASDIIMLQYEKPADTSESAKQKRANYGQAFLNKFSGVKSSVKQSKIVRATSEVNIRVTPDKRFKRVGVLKKDQSLEWLGTEKGWHKVAVYVSGEFSKVEE